MGFKGIEKTSTLKSSGNTIFIFKAALDSRRELVKQIPGPRCQSI